MGWNRLAYPGTEAGPCEGECTHVDCAETRSWAASACLECGQQMEYGRPFYADTENGTFVRFRHVSCEPVCACGRNGEDPCDRCRDARGLPPKLQAPISICWHCREVLGPDRVCSTHGQLR